jgi:hypothetical protein
MKPTIQPPNQSFANLAELIRAACIQAALEGYEDAAANGLCHEGAWEAAISAMQQLDLTTILQTELGDQTSSR